jgi:hypothetical protein
MDWKKKWKTKTLAAKRVWKSTGLGCGGTSSSSFLLLDLLVKLSSFSAFFYLQLELISPKTMGNHNIVSSRVQLCYGNVITIHIFSVGDMFSV